MSQRRTRRLGLLCAILGLGLLGGGLVSLAEVGRLGAEDGLCGPLTSDAQWTRDESPYIVTCDVTVEAGVRLEIEPGVEVRFESDTGLTVRGTMLALGTEGQPVVFTAGGPSPEPGDWDGLVLGPGSSLSSLSWCMVEHANVGIRVYAEAGTTVSPALAYCTVRSSASHGIAIEAVPSGCDPALAEPAITGCSVEGNGGCGIHAYGHGNPTSGCVPAVTGSVGGILEGNLVQQNQASGICLRSEPGYNSGGEVWTGVSRNRIDENAGDGVRLYGDDPVHSRIENNVILENLGAGLRWDAVHEGWSLLAVNNTIAANGGDGILSARPAGLAQWTNNIVVGNTGYGMFCASSEEPARSTNDVWGNVAGDYSGCTAGMTDLSADPLFVDVEGGNLRLRFGSPCIDVGVADSAPTMDIEGIPRPQGDGFDLGAYEFLAAEIEVRSGDALIPSGSQHDVGPVLLGSGLQTSFAIGNVGGSTLTVYALGVAPPGGFRVTLHEPLPLTLLPGASTAFEIWFEPKTAGEQTATVSIGSDDPDDNPYAFSVTGVGIQAPATVTVSGPTAGLIGAEQAFTATVGPGGATQPITFTWRASTQLPQVNTDGLIDTVAYVWVEPGVHGITVTARNAAGIATGTHRVNLYTPVAADFSAAPRSGPVPLAVAFTNTSTGDYDSSYWDFGDRLTSTLPSPTHTYRKLGVHTVTLQIAGPGGTDTRTKPAYVISTGIRLYLPLIERGTGEGLGDRVLTGRSR